MSRRPSPEKTAGVIKRLRKLVTPPSPPSDLDILKAYRKKARYGDPGTYGKPGGPAAPAVQLERMKMQMGKTAMPSKNNILKALGFTGLGAAAGGVGGYSAGHRSGMKRDAETPFGSSHMTYAYGKGRNDVIAALRKQMQAKGAKGQIKTAFVGPLADLGNLGIPSGIGYAMGRSDRPEDEEEARDQSKRPYNVPAGLLIPGYTGYHFGKKSRGKSSLESFKRKSKEKKSKEKKSKEKKASTNRKAILSGLAGVTAGGAGGYGLGKAKDKQTPYGSGQMRFAYAKGQQDVIKALRKKMMAGKAKTASLNDRLEGRFNQQFSPQQAKEMRDGLLPLRDKYQARVDRTKPGTAKHWFAKRQVAGVQKDIASFDRAMSKKAASRKQGITPGGAAKMIGIPTAMGGAMMGLMALRGKAPLGANVLRGMAGGAAVGTGMAGLIAMGQEIERADPSGRTLRTVVELAPSVLMAAGAAADLQKKAHVNLTTPAFILGY